jgi:FlaA1/EpsC-like NDP-sugar epimerase
MKAIDDAAVLSGTSSGEVRRRRASQPRLAIPLPPFDIRVRRELAHRRTIVAMGRHVLRILSLHVLDACAGLLAGFLALQLVPIPAGRAILPLMVGLVLLGLNGRRAYQPAEGRRDPYRILSGIIIAFIAAAMVSVFPPWSDLPIEFVAVFALLATAAILIDRAVVDVVVRALYERGVGIRRAIIIGKANDAQAVVAALQSDARDHFVVGNVSPGGTPESDALGALVDLEAIIRREEPAEIILSAPLSIEAHRRVADICVRNGVAILAVPQWTKAGRGWA